MELTPDPRVLGWLLATENVLQAIPTGRRQGEFVAKALKDIPGIARAGVCFEGVEEVCSRDPCAALEQGWAEAASGPCQADGVVHIPLDTTRGHYGRLVLEIADDSLFARYEPYLANWAGSLALLLENRAQQSELQAALESLSRSELRYRQLFTEMAAGHAVHEIILDESGSPVDYRFLELNPAFEQLTGLRAADVVGRKVSELLPGLEPDWVERYGRVALTGDPCHFEAYNQDLGRHYDVVAYRPEEGQFAVIFTDVTEHRLAREEAARLLEKQRALFLQLQEALLDIPDQLPGVRFGHEYRSATVEAAIGGDFYDVFATRDGRVGLLIGDVSGHGIEAARLATLVKDTVNAFAHQFQVPHLVLQETNRLLLQKDIPGFVSAFLAFLDPKTGSLMYSSAGHPPPFVAAGDIVTPLQPSGPVLGTFRHAAYRDNEVVMRQGETVVFYTDGITELRCEGRFYGEAALAAAVQGLANRPAEEIPSLLLEGALEFCGGYLHDDVALLAVSYVAGNGGDQGAVAETGAADAI